MSEPGQADPMAELLALWQAARAAQDGAANYIALSTLDETGCPASRMLTLRELVCYINSESPKALQLQADARFELLCFWPSLMVSARVRGSSSLRREQAFLDGWRTKPKASRYADLLHTRLKQSSTIASREALIAEMANLQAAVPEPQTPPGSLAQLIIEPNWIEILRISDADRLHQRTLWQRSEGCWTAHTLVP
jgi:pyridoxamine 5'-phosphate oxidase